MTGRVSIKPTLKFFESGASVCELNIAINRKNAVDYFTLKFWGDVAERAVQLQVGDMIETSGELQLETWSNEKSTGSKFTINAKYFEYKSAKQNSSKPSKSAPTPQDEF